MKILIVLNPYNIRQLTQTWKTAKIKTIIAAPDGLAWSRAAISIHTDNPYFILGATHTKKLQHIYNHQISFKHKKTRTRWNAIIPCRSVILQQYPYYRDI